MSSITREKITVGRIIAWTGRSGQSYIYWILPIGSALNAKPGNYVFARESGNKFQPIYVGQTDDLTECAEKYRRMPEIVTQGATHICAHTSSYREQARIEEENDIIDNYRPVCNGTSL